METRSLVSTYLKMNSIKYLGNQSMTRKESLKNNCSNIYDWDSIYKENIYNRWKKRGKNREDFEKI